MKEFIWKVCCLIWHFDERVIKEYQEREGKALDRYKEEQYQELKELEERCWQYYQKDLSAAKELDTHNIVIDEDNFLPYHYGLTIGKSVETQVYWNNIYDMLYRLGMSMGNKEDELREIKMKRV